MPEHVHLLVWPTTRDYRTSSWLTTIKRSVTLKAISYVMEYAPSFRQHMLDRQPNGEQHYRFWQRGGGYDRNLTEPTTIYKEIDYIHANPVRRRLCDRSTEWLWSSAVEYENPGTGLLSIDLSSLPR
jgi:putative transposase